MNWKGGVKMLQNKRYDKIIRNYAVCLLSTLLLLTGCGAGEQETVDLPQKEDAVQSQDQLQEQPLEETEPVNAAAPQISMEHRVEEVWNDAFTDVILNGTLEKANVTGEGYEAVVHSVEEWNQENEALFEESMELNEEWARSDAQYAEEYASEGEDWTPYYPSYSVDYALECTRINGHVISFLMDCYEFSGGAHGNYWYRTANFDAVSGERLTIGDLFADAEEFYQWAVDACWERILEEHGDGLFADAQETVRTAWENDPEWYLDAAGINVIFSPYEIGPYAMGGVRVVFSYEECAGMMKPEYMELTEEAMYLPWDVAAKLPAAEKNGYTQMELCVQQKEEWSGEVCLLTETATYSLSMGERGGSAYVIRKDDGRTLLLFDADMASDDYVTFVYDITGTLVSGEEPVLLEEESASILPGSVSSERIHLVVRVDLLGTYSSRQDYAISSEGSLERISENYEFVRGFGHGVITAKLPVPVICGGEEMVLPAGTRLRITGTDRESIAYFELIETGENGEIPFTFTEEGRIFVTIDGIGENEYFDDLPYAG